MKTYKIHFEQTNHFWIEVEAGSKKSAIKKAIKKANKDFSFAPDAIELPNGEEEEIEDYIS